MAEGEQFKVGEVSLNFRDIIPTQELVDFSADRLGRDAREIALLILMKDFGIEVRVDEGSLIEKISLYVGIAGLASSVLFGDFAIAKKNVGWLASASKEFFDAIVAHEKIEGAKLPKQPHDQDRVAIVRRRTTPLNKLQSFLAAKREVELDPGSGSRRAQLVDSAASLLRSTPGAAAKRELLSYLESDPVVVEVLRTELGDTHALMHFSRPPQARRDVVASNAAAAGTMERRRRLRPAIRRFSI